MVDDCIRKKIKIDSIEKNYELKELIGSGTYGLVYKAFSKNDKKKMAIKKFKPTKEGEGISLTAYREIMVIFFKIKI